MRRLIILLAGIMLIGSSRAQSPGAGQELTSVFSFENGLNGSFPMGWGGTPGTVFLDSEVRHGGRWSVRLERDARRAGAFSTITRGIPLDFTGTRIEWRGFLKTENVSDFVGLWMREDGDAPSLAFDNMQQRQVKGTNDWSEYFITLPVHPRATQLVFGVLVAGTGKLWVDDLQLLVDGKPVWEAPKAPRPTTVLDRDHEFDAGSRVALGELSALLVENLTVLGKVWGFLKYHHPEVVAGNHHWDYELFRVLPKVLAADSRNAANAAMTAWIRALGDIPACTACVRIQNDNLHLRPQLDWIGQEAVLGADLAALLGRIHSERQPRGQFYVSLVPNIGNPVFEHEPGYATVRFPDAGYQLLGLYRFWNIIQYWFPYRDVLDEDWDKVLREFVPRIALAKDKNAYQLEMLSLVARITDTHANPNVPAQVRPPAGTCQLPVITRFAEGSAVVTGYSEAKAGPASGFSIGDVIESLDGTPVGTFIERWSPYYPASNQPTRLRNIARSLTRGPCSSARAQVRRGNQTLELTAERLPLANLDLRAELTHDLPGETFRLLSEEVGYLKLSSIQAGEPATVIERFRETRGLIIDIRNYPATFVVFTLGSLLVDKPTEFARFTIGALNNPGAFIWGEPVRLNPQAPHYDGKVVVLVDETSVSQAEYTAMALRSSPRALVVGSTTAGADGNVSQILLPGGLSTLISGIGVFYPDKRPTQRVGIVPDVEVRPTIAGIRAGRDEVLEEAIRQILGPDTPSDRIQSMAKP